MDDRIKIINDCFASDADLVINTAFQLHDAIVNGSISINVKEVKLKFDVEIYTPYPLQFHDHETIRFINKNLIEFNHVNADGSICVHTFHSPYLSKKIELDINSLKHWISHYYINKEEDGKYEHIVVPDKEYNGCKTQFLFTDVNCLFNKYEFGNFEYSFLSDGNNKESKYKTYIVQSFNKRKTKVWCSWNSIYKNFGKDTGLYLFIENPPVKFRRFAVTNWKELEPYVDQSFFKHLYSIGENYKNNKLPNLLLPLLIGYKIDDDRIHWQVALIETMNFPNFGQKVKGTNLYLGMFYDYEVIWAQTKNCSPEYYFGRGILHSKLTDRKVMIIGVGAIGSIVATTLTRGGIKNLAIVDYDIKEPDNICRSEYSFATGITSKINELSNILVNISPFIEIQLSEILLDYAKFIHNQNEAKEILKTSLQKYDLIIDCSADHEVAYLLDDLNLNVEIISLSITNCAKELVCSVSPNIYKWSIDIHEKLTKENDDLYDPIGCWTATFRASYNDVAVLVQYAIKQINACYDNNLPVRNFYLSSVFEQELTIKLNQF